MKARPGFKISPGSVPQSQVSSDIGTPRSQTSLDSGISHSQDLSNDGASEPQTLWDSATHSSTSSQSSCSKIDDRQYFGAVLTQNRPQLRPLRRFVKDARRATEQIAPKFNSDSYREGSEFKNCVDSNHKILLRVVTDEIVLLGRHGIYRDQKTAKALQLRELLNIAGALQDKKMPPPTLQQTTGGKCWGKLCGLASFQGRSKASSGTTTEESPPGKRIPPI